MKYYYSYISYFMIYLAFVAVNNLMKYYIDNLSLNSNANSTEYSMT